MGCDIHFVIERKRTKEAKYVGVYSTCDDVALVNEAAVKRLLDGVNDIHERWSNSNSPLRHRNYNFFGALAGVRRDGPTPNGVPDDVSELAQLGLDDWDGNAHSHGHASLYDFIHTWLSVTHPDKLMLQHAESAKAASALVSAIAGTWIDLSADNTEEQYRVVYWFDN